MGLFKAIKKQMTNQFIAVIIYENSCSVKVKRIKKAEVLLEEVKEFELYSRDRLSKDVVTYIQVLQEEVEQTYIVLFLNSYGQGVVPSCLKSDYKKYHIDYNNVKEICIDKKYSIYASLIDIKWAEKLFVDTGIDFIFSPFLILDSLIKKETVEEKQSVTLYMMNCVNSITVMIFKGTHLLYGAFINIAKEEDLLSSDYESDDLAGDSLEDEMLEEIDLDLEMEENPEILDILDDVQSDEKQLQGSNINDGVEVGQRLFGQDLRLVKYFDASLREFYENELYESDFITAVKIYDSCDLSKEVISYLKEQLLVDIETESIDIHEQLLKLAMQERDINA